MELNILRADPAGNITVFVLDPVEKAQRAAIAEKIMAIPALKAEQVGYACTAEDNVDGHMEMMGGEFCGNATRAYGMYIAQQKGGLSSVRLRAVSYTHLDVYKRQSFDRCHDSVCPFLRRMYGQRTVLRWHSSVSEWLTDILRYGAGIVKRPRRCV